MKLRCFAWLLAAACLLLALPAPNAALADELIVEHNPVGDLHFANIQAAIDHADQTMKLDPTRSFSILVKADPTPYAGPITPISAVPIRGESTSGTFISVSGTGTLVNMANVSNVTIRNFTFKRSAVAISVTNSSSITISNNVFEFITGTAVKIQNSELSTSIKNNTFYKNGTAISTNSNIPIFNNIFANNTTAIEALTALSLVSFNDYFGNQTNGVTPDSHSIPNVKTADANPLFVDPVNDDFHLQPGSPAIDSGDPSVTDSFDGSISDMGAFGGPLSDKLFPATVTGLVSAISSAEIPPTVISLTWNPNSAAVAYRVYYGTSSRNYADTATRASEGASGFSVLVPKATLTFNSHPPAPAVLATAPTLAPLVPKDQALQLNWSVVPGATGYRIHYSTTAFDAATPPSSPTPIDVVGGSITSFLLPNLINGKTYFVRVSALAQSRIFAAVTAVTDTTIATTPGSAAESSFSQETSQGIGPIMEGPLSVQQSDFPEAIAPFPNLKNEGCFIATAAYGFYSAPQVQALREFRDRYLMTNIPGKAFVSWYYRHGPRGAHFLNAHPWLKPPVRLALFPLVAISLFLVHTSSLTKIAIMMIVAVIAVFLYQRTQGKMLGNTGGAR